MTLDSFNAFTVTVTPQSILWKYTFLRFTFERIHNMKEQTSFYEKAENHKAKERIGHLNHSNEQIFQVYLKIQGRIKESWKWGLYA